MDAVDCRLAAIAGFEAHKRFCDVALRLAQGQPGKKCIVLSVPGEDLLYCQYDFPWQQGDEFHIKMLQPMAYLRVAWTNLAQTHGLRTVLCLESRVHDMVGLNQPRHLAGWSLVKTTSAQAIPQLNKPAKKPVAKGLFGWLGSSVLDEVGLLRMRYGSSEMVDPTVLPRSQEKMVNELLAMTVSGREEVAALEAYLWLGHVCSMAAKSAYVRNRMMTTIGTPEGPVFLSLAFGILEVLKDHLAWTRLMAIVVGAWGKRDPAAAAEYHSLALSTLPYRILCPDPNALLRLIMFSGKGESLLQLVIDAAEPAMKAFAMLQAASWHRDRGDLAKALKIAKDLVRGSSGSKEPDVALYGIRAALVRCEVAFAMNNELECLAALRDLEQRDFSAASTQPAAYRAAKMGHMVYRARFHATHNFDSDAMERFVQSGLALTKEHPGESFTPSVVVAAAELCRLSAVRAFAQHDTSDFEAKVLEALRYLANLTDFRPEKERLITSFGPLHAELSLLLWLLDLIGGKKIKPSEFLLKAVRDTLTRNVDVLSNSPEFAVLKSTVHGFPSTKSIKTDELLEFQLWSMLQKLG